MPLDPSHHLGQTVGAKLRAARLAKKYTQNQLAQPDFSVSYISAIERGQIQPSLRALEILAQRLDLSTADLLPQHGQQLLAGRSMDARSVALSEERGFLLLEAQVLLRQGHIEKAIEILSSLLTLKGGRHQDISVRYTLGRAYLEGGYLQEGEYILAEAAREAREAQDPLYPRILSLQGDVYAALHNGAQAIRFQQASLASLAQWPASASDIFFLARVYDSLGQQYSQLGEFDRALEFFQQALRAVQTQSTYAQMKSVYENLFQQYQGGSAPELAALYRQKWLQADLQTWLTTIFRSEMQHYLGRALLKSHADGAYKHLLTTYQDAAARGDALTRASASIHLATWLIAHGEIGQAEPYAHEAQVLSSSFGETVIRADALFLQGEMAYLRREYEQGDQYFVAGLALLNTLPATEDFVERLTHYARLLEERGLVQEAIIYWKRAYEYRQKQ